MSSNTLTGVVRQLQEELQRLARMLPATKLGAFDTARIDASELSAMILELQAMRGGLQEEDPKLSVFDDLLPALAALRDVLLVRDSMLPSEDIKKQCLRIKACIEKHKKPGTKELIPPAEFPKVYSEASKKDLQGITDLALQSNTVAKHVDVLLRRFEDALTADTPEFIDNETLQMINVANDLKTGVPAAEVAAAKATPTGEEIDITLYAFDVKGRWECEQAFVQYTYIDVDDKPKCETKCVAAHVVNGNLTLVGAKIKDTNVTLKPTPLKNVPWFQNTDYRWVLVDAEEVGPIQLTNDAPGSIIKKVNLWVRRAPFEVSRALDRKSVVIRDRRTKEEIVVRRSEPLPSGLVHVVYTGKDKDGAYRHGLQLYIDRNKTGAVAGTYMPVVSAYAVDDVRSRDARVRAVQLMPMTNALLATTEVDSMPYIMVGARPTDADTPWLLHLVEHRATGLGYGIDRVQMQSQVLYGEGPTTDRWWKRNADINSYRLHRRVEARIAAADTSRRMRTELLRLYEAHSVVQWFAIVKEVANEQFVKRTLMKWYQGRLCERMLRLDDDAKGTKCTQLSTANPESAGDGDRTDTKNPVNAIVDLQRNGNLEVLVDFFGVPSDVLPPARARSYSVQEVKSLYKRFKEYLATVSETEMRKLRTLSQLLQKLSQPTGQPGLTAVVQTLVTDTEAECAQVFGRSVAHDLRPYVTSATAVVETLLSQLREDKDTSAQEAQRAAMTMRQEAYDTRRGIMERLNKAYQAEIELMMPEFERRLERMTEQVTMRTKGIAKEMQATKGDLIKLVEEANNHIKKTDDEDAKTRDVQYKTRKLMGFVDRYLAMYAGYRDFHVGFAVRSFREPMRLIRRQLKEAEKKKEKTRIGSLLDGIQQNHAKFTREFEQGFSEVFASTSGLRNHLQDYDVQRLRDKLEEAQASIADMSEKIVYVYNNDVSLADMMRDTQFMLLYVVKLVRFFIMWCALFLAESVFTNWYVDAVYTKKKPPPSLAFFVMLFVGIEAALFVVLWVILALVRHINDHDGQGFVIDAGFMQKLLVDYAISTVLIAVMGLVIGEVIQKRVVFNYATDGVAPVKAYKDILLTLAGFTLIVPYFAIVG